MSQILKPTNTVLGKTLYRSVTYIPLVFFGFNLYRTGTPYVVGNLNPSVTKVLSGVLCGHLNAPYTHVQA